METDAAFVRANGIVVLDAVAHVGLHVALVVSPRDAELVHAIGDAQTLDEVHLIELGVLVVLFFDSAEHFFYGLMVFRLAGETTLEVFQYLLCVHKRK